MSIQSLTATQLRKAADIKEKIESLHKQLAAILGGSGISAPSKSTISTPKKKSGISAAGKARIAAAQKLRWAKIKAAKPAAKAKPVNKTRKKMSAAAKANLSKLAKARWAKVKATGKKKL